MASIDDEIRGRVTGRMPQAVADLAALVRHRSVSVPGFPAGPCRAAASATMGLLIAAGIADVRMIELPDGYPVVFAEVPAPPGAPTVLLYAHYDVVAADVTDGWTSDPWRLTERDGRLWGRGAADDKCGIVMHAAALSVFDGRPPVGVKVVVEGEEETVGHLHGYVREHPDEFAADAAVIADLGGLDVGEPALTVTLRGEVAVVIEVRTLPRGLHSGEFGGPVRDALGALVRVLDRLVDSRGDVMVPGLLEGKWRGDGFAEDELRRWAGLSDCTALAGTGELASRLWAHPAATITGIDATGVTGAANRLAPTARARVTLRIAPDQDPGTAAGALIAHLERSASPGVEIDVRLDKACAGFTASTDGPVVAIARRALEDAFAATCRDIGCGATIPLLDVLRSAVPRTGFVLWGAADFAAARTHDVDESVDLRELERMILAEALLLQRLGDVAPARRS